jgi:ABC-type dipeptide/oligopeptide/nickel transport system permease subunit
MEFLRLIRLRYSRDKIGLLFAILFLSVYVVALTAQWIMPFDPMDTNLRAVFNPPSFEHLLGTDRFGRDILSRVILATQVSARVATGAVLIGLAFGTAFGMYVGYIGGIAEAVVMRLTDILLIFPTIMLAIVIVMIAGPSEWGVTIALAISWVPPFVRLSRAVTLSVREELYVEASIAAGAGRFHILRRHILPNISTPIIVQATLALPILVLSASSLSFLGLGVQPPTPEWGQMLNTSKDFLRTSPYLLIGPGVALFIFVLSSNMVGDALQETLNPRLREKK